MRTYTLHVPEGSVRGDPRALEQAHLVRDGFSWSAFAFTVLWFLRHRLWLAALLVLVGLVGLALAGRALGLSPFAALVVTLLVSLLIGMEASSLRRWTYGRRGKPAQDAVMAGSQEEAELKAAARWLDAAPVPGAATTGFATTAVSRPTPRRGDDAVIGLFPASEGGR
ncbi:UNVERIFIED_ORG: hypothetical protein M2438_003981 [Methylobacterium sp. SuP10 SLI 274]|uniref:DUF2628 domain-containing protein n=1 Tax=Methylorubrum extorquens TaxID=408 RepID=UPI00209D7EEE|nr:DUF2628 domain-containing protein [Methylorubrum extorquens]MDF9865237.1 hypothetical protein [Methylorubrum pseudosasae]MDH6638806.1 hypothetical protein [Methylobacterium sp. SuP10 SLI 274]MDH6667993.1 hypothetical protein [Methylorubrum zatmanii]MCP1559886.1 hypothetical protein [Methylorubrum extorquens]MDF9793531.1 hypothetical protein [Methylorubrum extorquens]